MKADFVAADVAQERMRLLTDVVERHALEKHEARIGRTESVLLEGPSKNDETMWSGRTRQNKLIHFSPGPGSPDERELRVGGTADVTVTYAAPHWLRGDLVSVHAAPRPTRIRIPVTAAPASLSS
jgi:tRNA-2-methylthio-N6-dimethylallyladenosine synthase